MKRGKATVEAPVEISDEEKVRQIVRDLSNLVNHSGIGNRLDEMFAKAWDNEHRTLQQGFGRWLVTFIRHNAAKGDGWYDLRNEATVLLCREIIKTVDDRALALPLI